MQRERSGYRLGEGCTGISQRQFTAVSPVAILLKWDHKGQIRAKVNAKGQGRYIAYRETEAKLKQK